MIDQVVVPWLKRLAAIGIAEHLAGDLEIPVEHGFLDRYPLAPGRSSFWAVLVRCGMRPADAGWSGFPRCACPR